MILKEIMRGVNRFRLAEHQLHPWQVFNMIGGTSTGGSVKAFL